MPNRGYLHLMIQYITDPLGPSNSRNDGRIKVAKASDGAANEHGVGNKCYQLANRHGSILHHSGTKPKQKKYPAKKHHNNETSKRSPVFGQMERCLYNLLDLVPVTSKFKPFIGK